MNNVPDIGPDINWPGPIEPPSESTTSSVELFGRTWWRAATYCCCPVCNHDSWCLMRPDEVMCIWDDTGKEICFDDGSDAHWHPLTQEAADRGFRRKYTPQDWQWRGSTTPLPAQPISAPSVTSMRIAPLAERDRVYRILLAQLGLSDPHRRDLHRRGLNDEAIRCHGYASLPRSRREFTALDIMNECRLKSLEGFPGFHQRRRGYGGPQWTIAGMAGLLIPYRDENGLIVFMQLRSDEDGTYFTFSTSPDKYDGGTKAWRIAHVAIPKGVNAITSDTIWITEGGLKGAIAAEFLRQPFIAVPGVGAWKLAFANGLLQTPRQIVVALDADKRINRNVARAEMVLVGELQRRGHRVLIANWDTDANGKPKGIDDLLAAGGKPILQQPASQCSAVQTDSRTSRAQATGPRLRECPPPAWLYDKQPVARSVAFAGGHVRGWVEAVVKAAKPGEGALLVRCDPFGVGKTTMAAAVLKDLAAGRWPMVKAAGGHPRPLRVALLVDSSREAEGADTIKKGKKLAGDIGDVAAYLEGRNERTCGRVDEVKALGEAGHDVMRALCLACQKRFHEARLCGDRPPTFINIAGPWKNVCPYLRQMDQAERVQIHVMHKAMLLNESKKAEDYDVIVVDESLTDALCGVVTLDGLALVTWMDEFQAHRRETTAKLMDLGVLFHSPRAAPQQKKDTALALRGVATLRVSIDQHAKLASLLLDCLSRLSRGAGLVKALPLTEVLTEVGKAGGVDVRRLVQACANGAYQEEAGREYFPHEKPRVSVTTNLLPVRAWRDVLSILTAEYAKPTGDHSAHVVFGKGLSDGRIAGKIELRVVRQHLLETLRQRTVIALDATPNLPLLDALFPRMIALGINVPQKVKVLQIADGIFGKSAATTALLGRLARLATFVLDKHPDGRVPHREGCGSGRPQGSCAGRRRHRQEEVTRHAVESRGWMRGPECIAPGRVLGMDVGKDTRRQRQAEATGWTTGGPFSQRFLALHFGHTRTCRLSGEENIWLQRRQDTFSRLSLALGFFSDMEPV